MRVQIDVESFMGMAIGPDMSALRQESRRVAQTYFAVKLQTGQHAEVPRLPFAGNIQPLAHNHSRTSPPQVRAALNRKSVAPNLQPACLSEHQHRNAALRTSIWDQNVDMHRK